MLSPRLTTWLIGFFLLCSGTPAAEHLRQEPDGELSQRMHAMRATRQQCEWTSLRAQTSDILARVARGSDAWLEAGSYHGIAAWKQGDLARAEEVARDVLASVAELRRARPLARDSQLGPIHPGVVFHVLQLETCLAKALQARAQHAEALGHARLLMQDLARSTAPAEQDLYAEVGLLAGESLLALGRQTDARDMLGSLRDGWMQRTQGATAMVLLEANGAYPEAYRGKYADDPDHPRRMERLWKTVPVARARLAAALGCAERELASPTIGVAVLPAMPVLLGAVTEGDPRRPALGQVIVFHSESFAWGLDLDTTLVHELSHATLMQWYGMRYEDMPVWLTEGIAQTLSGEIETISDAVLDIRHGQHAERFLSPDWSKLDPLVFEGGACDSTGAPEASLLILELNAAHEGHGLVLFLNAMRAGRTWREAIHEVVGLDANEYLVRARLRAVEILERKRTEALPGLLRLHRAQKGEGANSLECAADLLAHDPPRIVRGGAQYQLAASLEALGRFAESMAAWEEFLVPARGHGYSYSEVAHRGIVRCLIALDRREEAEKRLKALARDAVTTEARQWSTAQIAALRAKR